MGEQVTPGLIQAWIAISICISCKLQAKSEELKDSVHSSQMLHFKDLFTFSTRKGLKAEEELEISREQINTLEQELYDAYQKLEASYREIDACNQEMAKYALELMASSSILFEREG